MPTGVAIGYSYYTSTTTPLSSKQWGPQLDADPAGFCRYMHYVTRNHITRDLSFSEQREFDPGYDEIKPGTRVTVMGGPHYPPCSAWSSMKMYRVRLETQARGGSKTAYISASEIDDDRGAMKPPSGRSSVAASHSTPAPALAYLGPPGPAPNRETMSAAEYGAYTFASVENFCHMARWIISSTVAAEYANEAKPLIVKRNTKVQVLGTRTVSCGDIEAGLSDVNGDLTAFRILDGKYSGKERYAASSDVYSVAQYAQYRK